MNFQSFSTDLMLILCCLCQFIFVVNIALCAVISSNRTLLRLQQSPEPTSINSSSATIVDPSISADTFVLGMFPLAKGAHLFNGADEQEWQIGRDTDATFVVYGENLNGSVLSFTSHPQSCLLERKDRLYTLTVNTHGPYRRMSERAFLTINLPYYNSTLYVCLQLPNESYPIHQGDRPALKFIVTRRALPVWATILCLILLLSLSGLFSGLNLGLMSLTPHDLAVIQEAGTPNDRKYAKRIYPVRKRGNFLLCTILLGNVLVNSTTTILLDSLISGILAVAGATFAIVIFGEIIPQAICSRHGLKIGSKTILLTRIFMIITAPIAFPISKVLDLILGEEVGSTYTRDQMSALLKHTQTTDIEESEKNIMRGVLSLKMKKVRDIMTNLIDVFMLETDRVVDDELVLTVHGYGYSRIPVYENQRDNIIGLVNIRDFALLDTESGKFTVRSLMNFYNHRYGKVIMSDDSCYDVFNKLKKEQYHMGVVVEHDNSSEKDPKVKAVGIVTLEDIIEEMIQEEIIDETDVFTDNRGKVRNMLSQAPDFSVFIHQTETADDTTKISAQMKVAILQFLSTTVEPFTSRFISSHILARLLNAQFYQEFEYDEDKTKDGKATYIYENGRPADYFVLILNGQAELITGKDKIVSELGPFSYFGVSALCNSDNKVEDILRAKDLKFRPFIPDFSLRVCEDVQILRIRRADWLAAIRATFFDNKQKENGGIPMVNPDGKQIDLLTQELEKANCVHRTGTTTRTSSGTSGKIRDRTMSLTPVTASGSVKTEPERFFSRLRSKTSSHNADNKLSEIATSSNRNTPSLTDKQRHHLSRIDQT
ncbi:unnamed protein product [Rotaria magnacalcarata]|uniref:Metal transporter CNNM4 n=2 Tax=Rotaria magnacalcarata TaxID=392030 RepID=A0A819BRK3_9BILA|nr:unnamed protein product [Rotaria magnacalcarata]